MQQMSLNSARAQLAQDFQAVGIVSPEVEADLLLGYVLAAEKSSPLSRGEVQARAFLGAALSPSQQEELTELAQKRAKRIPLQHLTGTAAFCDFDLQVGPGVFIPRPETELLAAHAVAALQAVPHPEPIALDLCTGSGAIAIALARGARAARVVAVERETAAANFAAKNIAALGEGRVELRVGDALDPELTRDLAGRVAVLASNPPYVPTAEVPTQPEVRDYDPPTALYSGADGLDMIRGIAKLGRELVVPGGTLVLEHTEQQGEAVREVLAACGWTLAATHRDLTGRDRFTSAINPAAS